MDNPLEALLGNRTASKLMLYLFHYGEVYATGMAKDRSAALSPIQRQLDKFESGGFLISKLAGNTRVYSFKPKQPATKKLKEPIQVFYEAMSPKERQMLFSERDDLGGGESLSFGAIWQASDLCVPNGL